MKLFMIRAGEVRRARLSRLAYDCLFLLIEHANPDGLAMRTQKEMAVDLEKHPNSIFTAMRELQAAGLVAKGRYAGMWTLKLKNEKPI